MPLRKSLLNSLCQVHAIYTHNFFFLSDDRPYSPSNIYPTPYTKYLNTTPKPKPKPLNIYASKKRIERITHERQKYLPYLEKTKYLRSIGSYSGASSCENRHLCELGLVAVHEKNPSNSAHTLYKALWRISNE